MQTGLTREGIYTGSAFLGWLQLDIRDSRSGLRVELSTKSHEWRRRRRAARPCCPIAEEGRISTYSTGVLRRSSLLHAPLLLISGTKFNAGFSVVTIQQCDR